MSQEHDLSYYTKCMLGGLIACGATHSGITTLDLIKCRRQVNPNIYSGLLDGVRQIFRQDGFFGLWRGYLPTLIGYSAQGLCKFGFYEIFKDVYKRAVGEEKAEKYKYVGWSIASGSAEFIADIFLAPWEAIKVKVQTSKPGKFPRRLIPAMRKLSGKEGIFGFYKGLTPLWMRQIPYTIVKFVAFEAFVQLAYSRYLTKPKESYSRATQLSQTKPLCYIFVRVSFGCGYLAGIFCAIVSHPPDTIVSKLNNIETDEPVSKSIKKIYKDIGMKGLWRGLFTRILMLGTLTGTQWWIYDSFKTTLGLQTTGGAKKH